MPEYTTFTVGSGCFSGRSDGFAHGVELVVTCQYLGALLLIFGKADEVANNLNQSLLQSGVDLRITDDAIDYIAHEGYDPQFGARPVKRALQRLVLNELSKAIIAGKVDHQKPVIVELRDGELQFKN